MTVPVTGPATGAATDLRARHIGLGAAAALALHAGALWLAFSAAPTSGAMAPGVGMKPKPWTAPPVSSAELP